MAAGDLIVADFQLEIRSLLMGAATPYNNAPPGWGGLGLPPVKTQDVDLDRAHGSFLGKDYLTGRVLTFALEWHGTPAEVMNGLSTLAAAWTSSTVDVPLYLRLPGWGKFHVVGRPRGLLDDLSRIASGEGAALATFVTGSPAITFD